MWRPFSLILLLAVFGIPTATFGQVTSSDPQTLQALLTEVRELHKDLRVSFARVQSAQILLSRLQTQQAATTRASEHLDDARSKLVEAQSRQQHVAVDLKRVEDALSTEENLSQQKALQEEVKRLKSVVEVSSDEEQKRQATEIDAEQQLRTEQDKLNILETQLDQVVRKMTNSAEQ